MNDAARGSIDCIDVQASTSVYRGLVYRLSYVDRVLIVSDLVNLIVSKTKAMLSIVLCFTGCIEELGVSPTDDHVYEIFLCVVMASSQWHRRINILTDSSFYKVYVSDRTLVCYRLNINDRVIGIRILSSHDVRSRSHCFIKVLTSKTINIDTSTQNLFIEFLSISLKHNRDALSERSGVRRHWSTNNTLRLKDRRSFCVDSRHGRESRDRS